MVIMEGEGVDLGRLCWRCQDGYEVGIGGGMR